MANAIVTLNGDPLIRHKGISLKYSEVMLNGLSHRAYSYGKIGDYEKEISDLKNRQKGVLKKSDSVRLGVAYFRLGKCAESLQNFEQAVASNPRDSYVKRFGYFHSAIAKIFCKQSEGAKSDLERAQEFNPEFVYPSIWLMTNFDDDSFAERILANRKNSWQWALLNSLQKQRHGVDVDINKDLANKSFAEADLEQKKCEAFFYFGLFGILCG